MGGILAGSGWESGLWGRDTAGFGYAAHLRGAQRFVGLGVGRGSALADRRRWGQLAGSHAGGAASGCGGGLAGWGAGLGCFVGFWGPWQVSSFRHSRRWCDLAGQPPSAARPCCQSGGGSGAFLAGPAARLADVASADEQQLRPRSAFAHPGWRPFLAAGDGSGRQPGRLCECSYGVDGGWGWARDPR